MSDSDPIRSVPSEELRRTLLEFKPTASNHKAAYVELGRRDDEDRLKGYRLNQRTFVAAIVAAVIGLIALLHDAGVIPRLW
jgi:hypothetical protein